MLSDLYRTQLAADEAIGSVHRLLRLVELAGHDPEAVLDQALRDHTLRGSRSPAQVLQHRIAHDLDGQPLTPQLTSCTELVPAGVPAERRAWMHVLAETADQRRWELGARLAADPPQWARETLGPVPADIVGRSDWEERAGWAAAYRELTDHDHVADAIGSAPPPGLPEKHALWCTAHAALGLSEPGEAEDTMTEGRLRIRVRAYERELEWAPRWVGDELAATHRAAEQARTTAQLTAAHADATEDDTERWHLREAAAATAREAEELTERAAALESADHARGAWYAATAATRDAADRARRTLAERGVALDDPYEQTTADEWLAAHRVEHATDETDRTLLDEAELYDPARADNQTVLDSDALETAVPDIRDTSAREATEDTDAVDWHRLPTADETAAAVARAQHALAEIAARHDYEQARAAEEVARAEQLNQWDANDRATEQATRAADDALAVER